jgi:hypothetical protein
MRFDLRLALLVVCIAACSGVKPPALRAEVGASAEAEAPLPPSPARWAFTDRIGVIFDEATRPSALPRGEPAIVDGARVLLEAGIVVGSARHADRFAGFRSLPDRLGGGYLLWSQDRLYLAKEFLGTPRAIADVGATGGARLWFSSVLLRTPAGVFTIDPRAPGSSLRRVALPGLADGIALDDGRGVRLDLLSRAFFTVDGGATWTAVAASTPVLVHALREGPSGEIILEAEDARFVLRQGGGLAREDRAKKPADAADDAATADVRPRTSRELPSDALADAASGGALLPGGRVLVAHGGGARVLAARTALTIAATDLPSLEPRLSRCQAVFAGSPPAALACVADTGAFFLDLDPSLARPALEATFPQGGGGFFGGPRARLAYDGRCGPARPTSADLAAEAPAPATPPTASAAADELPPDDDARVCVRAAPSHWIERVIAGDDARHLYRWVPGDDGEVTALVLASAPPGPRDRTREGVRVVRVDPSDPALGGGAFPAVPPPAPEGAHRSVDVDFWQDEQGDLRGWVLLPGEGEKLDLTPSAQGPAHRLLPVVAHSGGRAAGVRISAAGHVTVLPLPKDVAEVLTGGPFGLAMATGEPEPRWYETTDGGASWTEIEGPPVGALEPATDESTPHACSPIGCTWGAGIVRLGWGGARPASAAETSDMPLTSRPQARVNLACRFDGPPPWASAGVRGTETPLVGLLVAGPKLGEQREESWTGDVLAPFDPASAPRKLPVTEALRASAAEVVPVLGLGARAEVDALVVIDKRRARASARAPAAFAPFDAAGRFVAAADLPGGSLAVLDADRGVVWLARGDATAAAVRLARVPDVSRMRFTLAQRIAPARGLALAASSTTAGDLVAGDLDLARADVGPLASLGRLDQLTEGACARASHRLVIDLPMHLRVTWAGKEKPLETSTTALGLIDAGGGAVCVEAVTVSLRKENAGPAVLRARLGAGGAASVWAEGRMARGVCTLDQSDRKR